MARAPGPGSRRPRFARAPHHEVKSNIRGLPATFVYAIAALRCERLNLAGIISIERLSKTFETARGTSHLALSNISLDVAEGEFVSILGPSGCGKSTLLYIVGGFVAPSEGAVRVKGAAVT